MNCPCCSKEVVADRLFCHWCEAFIPNPSVGKKSGLFRRLLAHIIDPIVATILYSILSSIFVGIFGHGGGGIAIIIVTIGYAVFFCWFLSKGMTLGKWLFREKVVEKLTGNYPGFWRMVLRETLGKGISAIVFCLGFFWAMWDKDNQAWHDKIAGTVVVRRP